MAIDTMRAHAEDTFADERVWELSVYSLAGRSVESIARQARLPNGQIRVSTVARIRAAGYDVLDRRSDGHCRLPLPAWPTDEDLERCQRLLSCYTQPARCTEPWRAIATPNAYRSADFNATTGRSDAVGCRFLTA